jgi:hypothetical protein
MNNDLFVTDQSELEETSWRLLLRQKSETEQFKERQKEILKEVREW